MAYSAYDILSQAQNDIIQLAAEVGIDGSRLLHSMPPIGRLTSGNKVPVIAKRFKSSCSVIFHINKTSSGNEWPLLRLSTFKDGGATRIFNGLRWFNNNKNGHNPPQRPITIGQQNAELTQQQEEEKRLQRHTTLEQLYHHACDISHNHPWLKYRLNGYCTQKIINRTNIKIINSNELLIPIKSCKNQVIGFQKIIINSDGDKKLFLTRKSGLLNGSSIRISASPGFDHSLPALCEGVSTALTIALIWPGKIYIALTADNIKNVRNTIDEPVAIFSDSDIWKDNAGNVGRKAALCALKPNDQLFSPCFDFAQSINKPTDFNDMLRLQGLATLQQRIAQGSEAPTHHGQPWQQGY